MEERHVATRVWREVIDAAEERRTEELELALRARTDRTAFGELYDRYLQAVHAYCYRRLGHREAAEDATAIVFTKALGAVVGFREDAPSFRAWLFAIAHNVVVDEWRARRQTLPLDESVAMPARGPGPEEIAVRRADLTQLRSLLADLPPDQAAILELRLAGLTDKEIAHVLGRSQGSVRVAQHRAIHRLRGLFRIDPESSP